MLFLLLTLLPALCFAFGNVLEKSGIASFSDKVSVKTPFAFFKKVFSNGRWWLGIFFSGIATLGYYAAMALYDLSLVQPMMVLNPVLTALFGYWFLKEHLSKRIVCAIFCVLIGLLLAAKNIGENTGTQNAQALWLFSLGIILLTLSFRVLKKDLEAADSLIVGAGFGLSAVFYKSLALDFDIENFSWDVLSNVIFDFRALAYAILYGTAFLYSQIAFSRGRALFVIPFSAAVGAAIPILAGAFVFEETFPPNKIISVALVLLGSFLFIVKSPLSGGTFKKEPKR